MAVRAYTDAKGRRRYEVEFEARGHRVHRRAPPGTTQAQAAEWELKLRRETFDAVALGHRPAVLLTDLVQSWLDTRPHKSHRNIVSMANILLEHIEGRYTPDAPECARSARQAWAKAGYATATINRRLTVLKASLTVAGYKDIAAQIECPPEHNAVEVYLTKKQVGQWADAVPDERLSASVWIAAYTGMRASELLAAGPPEDGTFRVLGKGRGKGKYRLIPVAKPLEPYLWALPLGVTYDTWYHALIRARDAAGLPATWHPHVLRHTFASLMIRAGADLLTLSKLMGHSGVQVTQRYAHLCDDHLKLAMGKLR